MHRPILPRSANTTFKDLCGHLDNHHHHVCQSSGTLSFLVAQRGCDPGGRYRAPRPPRPSRLPLKMGVVRQRAGELLLDVRQRHLFSCKSENVLRLAHLVAEMAPFAVWTGPPACDELTDLWKYMGQYVLVYVEPVPWVLDHLISPSLPFLATPSTILLARLLAVSLARPSQSLQSVIMHRAISIPWHASGVRLGSS